MAERSSTLSVTDEGAIVGAIGAVVVALWYLALDSIAGLPLRTPSVLGQVVLFGSGEPVTDRIMFGAVIVYTAFHFVLFLAFGIGLAALVRWAARESAVRYALLQVFLAFEVFFYGFLQIFAERAQNLFPFWSVLGANTLAAVAMGIVLWRMHPELRASLREVPLGDEPIR